MDFFYCGEVSIYKEDLYKFLSLVDRSCTIWRSIKNTESKYQLKVHSKEVQRETVSSKRKRREEYKPIQNNLFIEYQADVEAHLEGLG